MHIPRAMIGVTLVVKLPNTHDLIHQVDIPQNQKIPFDKIGDYVMDSSKSQFATFAASNGKLMNGYVIMTLLTWFCDLISFFVGVHEFSSGSAHDSYPGTILLAFGCAFLALDMYYVVWVISMKLKLPPSVSGPVTKSLGGKADTILNSLKGAQPAVPQASFN